MTIKWVVSDPLVMNGEPFCYGTRLTVRNILELRSAGYTLARMLKDHPELRRMGAPVTPTGSVTSIGGMAGSSVTVPLQNVTLADALAEVERRMIGEALRKHNGNISRAARELGLTRRGLYLKLDRLEMTASA